MSRDYFVVFFVVIWVLILTEANGQSTLDDSETCINSLPTSDQVAQFIREGVNKVIASYQQQPGSDAPVDELKYSLISALKSNCIPLMIQQNVDGSGFFNRSWAEFKVGFSDSSGNFWLGNDLLHQLTTEARYKLRCLVQARSNGIVYVANYDIFVVGPESSNYTLRVAQYSGNAGDSMSYHSGMMFSTFDRDNDQQEGVYWEHCARYLAGGFWYKGCFRAGVNVKRGQGSSFSWYGLPAAVRKELMSASMWLTC